MKYEDIPEELKKRIRAEGVDQHKTDVETLHNALIQTCISFIKESDTLSHADALLAAEGLREFLLTKIFGEDDDYFDEDGEGWKNGSYVPA